MPTLISTLGLRLISTLNLQNQQGVLAKLNEQLATGKLNKDLTDYTPAEARNLLDFQNNITQRRAFIAGMQTVNTRLKVYDQTMEDIEKITGQAQTLAAQNQTYDPSRVAQLRAQVGTYLKQVGDDLNQRVGDRYIYAGIRYSTQPVLDLTTLGAPTIPFTPSVSPNLPDYDSQFTTNPSDADAFIQDTVSVDTSFSIQYGVTSNNGSFQKIIAGLRLFSAATQETDPAVYQTSIINASNLLSSGLTDLQAVHANVANNLNILKEQTDSQTTNVNSLLNQISDIQRVDLTEVGAKISLLQVQLQASYSATASIQQLSILSYLR